MLWRSSTVTRLRTRGRRNSERDKFSRKKSVKGKKGDGERGPGTTVTVRIIGSDNMGKLGRRKAIFWAFAGCGKIANNNT